LSVNNKDPFTTDLQKFKLSSPNTVLCFFAIVDRLTNNYAWLVGYWLSTNYG